MTPCFIFIDRCDCPHGKDEYGNMEEFHNAADEITEEITLALKVNPDEQREI